MFKRILVPLDGSSLSEKALPYAVEIARRFGAEVAIVQEVDTVLSDISKHTHRESLPVSKLDLLIQEAHEQDKQLRAAADQYLNTKLKEIEASGIKGSYYLVTGAPAHSIMEFCEKAGVDLIVMTTHGRGGIKRAILGSVADEVIRESTVPLLLIRPPAESQ